MAITNSKTSSIAIAKHQTYMTLLNIKPTCSIIQVSIQGSLLMPEDMLSSADLIGKTRPLKVGEHGG